MSVSGEARPVYIVTDSTADIPDDLLRGRPITVVPLTVELSGQVYRDGVDLTRDEFLDRLRHGALPRTSQPPIGVFQDVYRRLIERGYDVLAIHIASGLSGTYNASRSAAESIAPDHIHVIDSGTVSMGFGWIVIEAADLALSGMHLKPLAAYAERRRADQRVLALLETLEYLRRGGRIGRTAAFLGSALQITPIVAVRDGEVVPLERVRTVRRALERLLALAGAEGPFDRLAVLHLGSPDAAADLADRLAAVHPGVPIVRSQVGTVIGTYGGPGVLGFAGLVTPRDLLST